VCRLWEFILEEEMEFLAIGSCHANAPSPYLYVGPTGDSPEEDAAGWPITEAYGWCRFFEPGGKLWYEHPTTQILPNPDRCF
jgi:hypothetical protein